MMAGEQLRVAIQALQGDVSATGTASTDRLAAASAAIEFHAEAAAALAFAQGV
jgi:hypothetical protein